jgi:ribosomal-protein-serine acetyltransferase
MDVFKLQVDDDSELVLRSQTDAERFFRLTDTNRTYLRPWLPWVDHTNAIEDTAEYIRKCEAGFRAGTQIDVGIRYKGDWVGSVGLNDISKEDRKAEIGYWLAEDAQGKGTMTRAVQALVDHGFSQLDLNRIWIRCAAENEKSAAVPRRLGFTHEGTLRQNERVYDHFEDQMVWSLLRSEWEQRRA